MAKNARYLLLPLFVACITPTLVAQKGPTSRKATSRPTARITWVRDGAGKFQVFGEKLAKKPPLTVNTKELVKDLEKLSGKTVRVTGEVEGTCAKKGCWMWVRQDKQRVFVRFKDYGFFVPTKGAEGRQVVFEGVVAKKKLSVEEARHYAEDAGDHEGAKKITKPQVIPFVMATGVRMYAKPVPKKAAPAVDGKKTKTWPKKTTTSSRKKKR